MSASVSGRLAMAGLLAALCATAACDRGSPANGQAEANLAAAAEPPVSPDEAAPSAPASKAGAVDRSHAGETPPAAAFTDAAGKRTTIADFKGHPVLVNLWATWCAPCVKELPTLDAVAKRGMSVAAISQDMDAGKAKTFLEGRKLTGVTPYYDPDLGLSTALGANLPTTILYGADGREKWRVTGELDWTGDKAKALLAEAG